MDILPYKLESSKELITSRAGILPLAELLSKINLPGAIDKLLGAQKSNRSYKHSDFIISYILSLHMGAQSLSDISLVANDSVLRELLSMKNVPCSSAIGKWFKRVGKDNEISELLSYTVANALHNCKDVTLDIDATFIESLNKLAQYSYIGKGYMPMIGTIAETSQIIGTDFREGNAAPCSNNHEFIEYCRSKLPKGINLKAVRIDAAGYQYKIIDWLIDEEIEFAIRACMSKSLREEVLNIKTWNNNKAKLVHTMGESAHSFDLVVQRHLIEGQLNLDVGTSNEETISCGKYMYRAIATNSTKSCDDLVDWYNQRANDSENRIKDLKLDFGANKMPFFDFKANSLYLEVCALAYNIFQLLKLVLPSEFHNARLKRVSTFIYSNAAKVIKHARQTIVKIQESAFDSISTTLENIKSYKLRTSFLE